MFDLPEHFTFLALQVRQLSVGTPVLFRRRLTGTGLVAATDEDDGDSDDGARSGLGSELRPSESPASDFIFRTGSTPKTLLEG
jgi:hypothetical protein